MTAPLPRPPAARRTSCGVLVSDGPHLLLGHAPRSRFWDIPKGGAEPGEGFAEAAARELAEETGLVVPAAALRPLGLHGYLPAKDLAIFAWPVARMPDPSGLRCSTWFRLPGGGRLPEFDRFAVLPWAQAFERLGRNMVRVLAALRAGPDWPFG